MMFIIRTLALTLLATSVLSMGPKVDPPKLKVDPQSPYLMEIFTNACDKCAEDGLLTFENRMTAEETTTVQKYWKWTMASKVTMNESDFGLGVDTLKGMLMNVISEKARRRTAKKAKKDQKKQAKRDQKKLEKDQKKKAKKAKKHLKKVSQNMTKLWREVIKKELRSVDENRKPSRAERDEMRAQVCEEMSTKQKEEYQKIVALVRTGILTDEKKKVKKGKRALERLLKGSDFMKQTLDDKSFEMFSNALSERIRKKTLLAAEQRKLRVASLVAKWNSDSELDSIVSDSESGELGTTDTSTNMSVSLENKSSDSSSCMADSEIEDLSDLLDVEPNKQKIQLPNGGWIYPDGDAEDDAKRQAAQGQ